MLPVAFPRLGGHLLDPDPMCVLPKMSSNCNQSQYTQLDALNKDDPANIFDKTIIITEY